MEETYKVVLLGEAGVGKTSIISRYINDEFDENSKSNLNAQFNRKTIPIGDDKEITLDIWDTAGQEKYRAISRIYYKDASAVILVYSITNKKSLEEIKNYWHLEVVQSGPSDIVFAVAGNKSDLYQQRQISYKEGKKFAKNIEGIFAEISAKDYSGIDELFEKIGKKIMNPDIRFDDDEDNDEEEEKKEELENKNKKENNRKERNKGVKLDGKNGEKGKKKGCCKN